MVSRCIGWLRVACVQLCWGMPRESRATPHKTDPRCSLGGWVPGAHDLTSAPRRTTNGEGDAGLFSTTRLTLRLYERKVDFPRWPRPFRETLTMTTTCVSKVPQLASASEVLHARIKRHRDIWRGNPGRIAKTIALLGRSSPRWGERPHYEQWQWQWLVGIF